MPRRVHDALYLQEAGCEGRGEAAQRFLDKLHGMMQHASKQAHPIHGAEGLRLPTSVAEAAAAPPASSVPVCPAAGGGGAAAGDGRGGRGVGAGWEQAASRRSRRRRLWPSAGEQEAEAEGLDVREERRAVVAVVLLLELVVAVLGRIKELLARDLLAGLNGLGRRAEAALCFRRLLFRAALHGQGGCGGDDDGEAQQLHDAARSPVAVRRRGLQSRVGSDQRLHDSNSESVLCPYTQLCADSDLGPRVLLCDM